MTLSIVTINYNNVAGLTKTIASVLSQTWKDFEWIVVDGGSTDGSKELIEAHQQHFSFWCSEHDGGIYNAMNKAVSHALGRYVCFLNSADVFYSETTLEEVFSVQRTADILYGDWVKVYKKGMRVCHYPKDVSLYTFYRHNICQQAMFVRTALLRAEGFDESYQVIGDWKRWVMSALRGDSFEYLNIRICRFDTQGISSTHNDLCDTEPERMRQEVFPPLFRKSMERLDVYERNFFVKLLKPFLFKA